MAPSAPTTRSKPAWAPALVCTSPRVTDVTRSSTRRAPAARARLRSHASSSLREATATGSSSGTSTAASPASKRQAAIDRDRQRIVCRRRRQRVQGLAGQPPAAGLLPRVGGVEEGGRSTARGQTRGQERARGSRSHDRDLHEEKRAALGRQPRASKDARISSGAAVAVPTLPTTTPAVRFASWAASGSVAPAQRARARVAITVSPAPVTS